MTGSPMIEAIPGLRIRPRGQAEPRRRLPSAPLPYRLTHSIFTAEAWVRRLLTSQMAAVGAPGVPANAPAGAPPAAGAPNPIAPPPQVPPPVAAAPKTWSAAEVRTLLSEAVNSKRLKLNWIQRHPIALSAIGLGGTAVGLILSDLFGIDISPLLAPLFRTYAETHLAAGLLSAVPGLAFTISAFLSFLLGNSRVSKEHSAIHHKLSEVYNHQIELLAQELFSDAFESQAQLIIRRSPPFFTADQIDILRNVASAQTLSGFVARKIREEKTFTIDGPDNQVDDLNQQMNGSLSILRGLPQASSIRLIHDLENLQSLLNSYRTMRENIKRMQDAINDHNNNSTPLTLNLVNRYLGELASNEKSALYRRNANLDVFTTLATDVRTALNTIKTQLETAEKASSADLSLAVTYKDTDGAEQSLTIVERTDTPAAGEKRRIPKGHMIGEGAMGEVYLATGKDGKKYAIKVVKLLPSSYNAGSRLATEGEISKLSHANIVKVHGKGMAGEIDCIVMEYIDGAKTLAAERSLRRSLTDIREIALQITRALAYAHEQKENKPSVSHRDLKPENIFVAQDHRTNTPLYLVGDWGLAFVADAFADADFQSATKTQAETALGQIFGTPSYNPAERVFLTSVPKQCIADGTRTALQAKGDVYSLGIMLYELATGTRPFIIQAIEYINYWLVPATKTEIDKIVNLSGVEQAQYFERLLLGKAAELSLRRPTYPPVDNAELQAIIAACLEPNALDRISSAELLTRLTAWDPNRPAAPQPAAPRQPARTLQGPPIKQPTPPALKATQIVTPTEPLGTQELAGMAVPPPAPTVVEKIEPLGSAEIKIEAEPSVSTPAVGLAGIMAALNDPAQRWAIIEQIAGASYTAADNLTPPEKQALETAIADQVTNTSNDPTEGAAQTALIDAAIDMLRLA